MIKYEYEILSRSSEHTTEYLNGMGEDGWKIVGVSGDSYNIHSIIMMREIAE